MAQNYRFGPEILLIDQDGKNLGLTKLEQATSLAENVGLDLVEVGKQKDMHVCRIMDRGKWRYEQSKKKKKHSSVALKEIKMGVRIDTHDLEVKINHIRKFLEKGMKVRVLVEMRGRERAHPKLSEEKMAFILEKVASLGKVDEQRKTNSNISVLVTPLKRNENGKGQNNRHEG